MAILSRCKNKMKRHIAILLVALSANAVAQSFIFNSYPGCWTGPRRSRITASVESGASFCFLNSGGVKQESVNVGTSKQVQTMIDKLSKLELSKGEAELWSNRHTAIGPGHYELKLELTDRSWRVHYPDYILGLKESDRAQYDKATLTVIDKITKMHNVVFALLPKKVAEQVRAVRPHTAPQPKSQGNKNTNQESKEHSR